jgi:hypothetical protein
MAAMLNQVAADTQKPRSLGTWRANFVLSNSDTSLQRNPKAEQGVAHSAVIQEDMNRIEFGQRFAKEVGVENPAEETTRRPNNRSFT